MPDPRNPLNQALDLMVYAPLGLAITVLEDFGELAEKGRARVQQRTTAARLIGRFAVAEGRRRLGVNGVVPNRRPAPPAPPPASGGGTDGPAGPRSDAAPTPAEQPGAAPDPAVAGTEGPLAGPGETLGGASANVGGEGIAVGEAATAAGGGVTPTPEGAPAGAPEAAVTATPEAAAAGAAPGGSREASAVSDSLAIPGYDSLSASQVVQRLPSLSATELAAVADYEAGTRGRRTILARIAQLQQG